MVLQEQIFPYVLGKIAEGTYTTEIGESTNVDFSDNSLDTVHATVSDPIITQQSDRIMIDTLVPSGTANGNNIDAFLQKADGFALNKALIVSVAKTVDKVLENRQQIIMLVE